MLTVFEQLSWAARKLAPFTTAESGLHGVFKRLADEHALLKMQFWAVVTTHDVEQRRERWHKLRARLVFHEQAELQLLRELEWHPGLIELVDARENEAEGLLELVGRVDADIGNEASCKRAIRALWAAFSRQTERNEAYYFPVIQHALGEVMCEALDSRYSAIRGASARND